MNEGETSSFRAWWRRQQFEPGAAGLLVNPFFFARRGLKTGLEEFFPELQGEVLDVGCGQKPYRHLVPAGRYVGVDIDTAVTRRLGVADFFYDGRRLPFADGSFDAVLCSQVLEHVFTPAEFLDEIHRVLRPGGKLLLATPMVWDEHEQPYDFARYSSFGLRDLVSRAGFEIVAQRKTCADFRAIVQLTSAYLFKVTRVSNRPVRLIVQLGLLAPVNILGAVFARLLPGNQDFYLDNVMFATKRRIP